MQPQHEHPGDSKEGTRGGTAPPLRGPLRRAAPWANLGPPGARHHGSVITGAVVCIGADAPLACPQEQRRAAGRRARPTAGDRARHGGSRDTGGWMVAWIEHVISTQIIFCWTRTVTPNVWKSSFVVSCMKAYSASPVHAGRAFARIERGVRCSGPGRSAWVVAIPLVTPRSPRPGPQAGKARH